MSVEMTIESVRVSRLNYQRVVVLKEKDAERYLPIWIGPAEAEAIALQLQDFQSPRPLTHDLLKSVIAALGGAVRSIVVCDLNDDTYYARIKLTANGADLEIDSRPSDALALAVRVQVPIFAEEAVLEKAGVKLDPETGQLQASQPDPSKLLSEEERQRLSAFSDFINSLDLDDFDKKNK